MSKSCYAVVLVVGALVAGSLSTAFADEAGDAGRGMLEKHKNAVVTIKLVIKQQMSMMGNSNEEESKTEVTGTVIDESGLTVVSLASTDPSSLLKDMMGGMGGDMGGFKMETRVTDADILMDDGTEIPAKVVLRDRDLDLAFIRPTEKVDKPFEFIDLKDAGEPQVLDQLIALNRLGKVASRSYAASVERVESVITKPRKFYLPAQNQSSASVGSPAFTLDGKVVGVGVLRSVKTGGDGMMGMLGMLGGGGGNLPKVIILPCKDILKVADQAPQADEVADDTSDDETSDDEAADDTAAGDEGEESEGS